jgi:hypothetical protein
MRLRGLRSPKTVRAQPAPFYDALERPNRDGLVAMHCNDDLAAVGMAPFLMATLLSDLAEPVPT